VIEKTSRMSMPKSLRSTSGFRNDGRDAERAVQHFLTRYLLVESPRYARWVSPSTILITRPIIRPTMALHVRPTLADGVLGITRTPRSVVTSGRIPGPEMAWIRDGLRSRAFERLSSTAVYQSSERPPDAWGSIVER
jgi:hypothetical protein